MKKENLIPTAIALIIGIAGVALLLFAWHLPPFHPARPETENAYVRGMVTTVAPQASGYVAAVEVADFQTIAQGDIIARIDDRIPRQKLAQAQAQAAAARAATQVANQSIASAQAAMRANQAAVAAAQSALTTADAAWGRASALQTRGVAAQSATDQSELSLQQARAALQQAQAQVDVQREAIASARVQMQATQADIASADAAVELAQIDLDNTVIRAPSDGHLGQVSVRVGQYVTAGSALVSLIGTDTWVIANFRETNLRGMREGEPAAITVDALDHRVFTGRVQAFSPATASEYSLLSGANATGNFTKIAQRLPVRISIDPGQPMAEYLRPGMSVVVRVDTSGAD